mgnify:CR=1 FL=1
MPEEGLSMFLELVASSLRARSSSVATPTPRLRRGSASRPRPARSARGRARRSAGARAPARAGGVRRMFGMDITELENLRDFNSVKRSQMPQDERAEIGLMITLPLFRSSNGRPLADSRAFISVGRGCRGGGSAPCSVPGARCLESVATLFSSDLALAVARRTRCLASRSQFARGRPAEVRARVGGFVFMPRALVGSASPSGSVVSLFPSLLGSALVRQRAGGPQRFARFAPCVRGQPPPAFRPAPRAPVSAPAGCAEGLWLIDCHSGADVARVLASAGN